jgi:D-3-phosphoglycerate dehydrogenase
MKKALITAPAHPVLQQALRDAGYEVIYEPAMTPAALLETINDVEGLVVTTRVKIDAALIDQAAKLRWIGRLGSGMELIDVAYAESKGIACFSSPEGNRNAVAEHTLGLALALLNHIPRAFEQVKNAAWLRNENRGTELSGMTVGIIGFGNTGSAFARLLPSFGVRALAYDKYKKGFSGGHIRESGLAEIQSEAQLISLHLPLTAETRHYANDEFFAGLTQKPWFLSTCRGAVTDTAALLRALEQGKLSGAALDVLENEKPAAYTEEERAMYGRLFARPDVIVTPHVAGYSEQAFRRMPEVLLEKLATAGLL